MKNLLVLLLIPFLKAEDTSSLAEFPSPKMVLNRVVSSIPRLK